MKKQIIAGLSILAVSSMLCGFDSAETLDSISEKMSAVTIDSMTADTSLNLDAALNMSDGTNESQTPVLMTADFDTDYTMEPFAMQMDGTMDLSVLTEGQSAAIQSYVTTDDEGKMKMYIYQKNSESEEGSWIAQTFDNLDIQSLLNAGSGQSMSFSELEQYGFPFELAPEAADVNGTECYLLSTTIDADSLSTLLEKVSELSGKDLKADENVNMALSMLTGLKLNLEYYVDASTYHPIRVHFDMNGSDLSTINQLLSLYSSFSASEDTPATTMELVLNDLSLDMDFSYEDVPEIVIPEEALAAPELSTDDLLSGVAAQ